MPFFGYVRNSLMFAWDAKGAYMLSRDGGNSLRFWISKVTF